MINLSPPLTGLILKFEVVVDQSVCSTVLARFRNVLSPGSRSTLPRPLTEQHRLKYLCSCLLARASFCSSLPNFSLASCFCCWLTKGRILRPERFVPLTQLSHSQFPTVIWNLLGSRAFTDDACANASPSRSCSPAVLRAGLLLSSWMVAFIVPNDAALVSDIVEDKCTSLSSHTSDSRCVFLSPTIADAGCASLIWPTSDSQCKSSCCNFDSE